MGLGGGGWPRRWGWVLGEMLQPPFSTRLPSFHRILGSWRRRPGPRTRQSQVGKRVASSALNAPRAGPGLSLRHTSRAPGHPEGRAGTTPGPQPPARRRQPAPASRCAPEVPQERRRGGPYLTVPLPDPSQPPLCKISPLRPAGAVRGTAIRVGATPPRASPKTSARPTWLAPPLPRQEEGTRREGRKGAGRGGRRVTRAGHRPLSLITGGFEKGALRAKVPRGEKGGEVAGTEPEGRKNPDNPGSRAAEGRGTGHSGTEKGSGAGGAPSPRSAEPQRIPLPAGRRRSGALVPLGCLNLPREMETASRTS